MSAGSDADRATLERLAQIKQRLQAEVRAGSMRVLPFSRSLPDALCSGFFCFSSSFKTQRSNYAAPAALAPVAAPPASYAVQQQQYGAYAGAPVMVSPYGQTSAPVLERAELQRRVDALRARQAAPAPAGPEQISSQLGSILDKLTAKLSAAADDDAAAAHAEPVASRAKSTMEMLSEQNMMMQNMMMQNMLQRQQEAAESSGKKRRGGGGGRKANDELIGLRMKMIENDANYKLMLEQAKIENERNLLRHQQQQLAMQASALANPLAGGGGLMPGGMIPGGMMSLQGGGMGGFGPGLGPAGPAAALGMGNDAALQLYNPDDRNAMPAHPYGVNDPALYRNWQLANAQINGNVPAAGSNAVVRERALRAVKRAMIVVWFCLYMQAQTALLRKQLKKKLKTIRSAIVDSLPPSLDWLRRGFVNVLLALVNVDASLELPVSALKKGVLNKTQRQRVDQVRDMMDAICIMLSQTRAIETMPDQLLAVLKDLTAEGAVFPEGFLMPIEADYLNVDSNSVAHDMTRERRRLVVANFILTRMLIGEIVLQPVKFGFALEPTGQKVKKRNKKAPLEPAVFTEVVDVNCRVLAALLYRAIRGGIVEPGERPVDAEELIIQEIVPADAVTVLLDEFDTSGSMTQWETLLRAFYDNVIMVLLSGREALFKRTATPRSRERTSRAGNTRAAASGDGSGDRSGESNDDVPRKASGAPAGSRKGSGVSIQVSRADSATPPAASKAAKSKPTRGSAASLAPPSHASPSRRKASN